MPRKKTASSPRDAGVAIGSSTSFSVVLADDHALFREGLASLLEAEPRLKVVAHASTGDDAVAALERTKPNLLLLDVEMPGLATKAVIAKALELSPKTHVVILTMHHDSALVRELIGAGADAFLPKTLHHEALIASLLEVALLDHDVVTLSIPRLVVIPPTTADGGPIEGLSPRELDVLQHVAHAESNNQIARSMNISSGTVKRHLTNVFLKLGAGSRMEAVKLATERGILSRFS